MGWEIKQSKGLRINVNLDGVEYDAKFVFETVGYNLEGSEIGAAFGLEQLKSLNQNISIRKKNFNIQSEFFNNHSDLFSIPEENKRSNTAWLAFPILIKKDAPFKRKDFQIYLEKRKIQTRVVFTGNILRQPMMKNVEKRVSPDGFPNADSIMERGILLPLHHGMTNEMFERFHSVVDNFIKEFS